MYFVIHNSDGDTHVEQYTKRELLRVLNDGDYGDIGILDVLEAVDSDTNYWGENLLIIKGEVVSPIEKKTVVEFDIE